jgi:membrane-associated protease RseP (regulator of RpoE activity)
VVPINFCITDDSSAAKRTIIMNAMPDENVEASSAQVGFEQVTGVVSSEFRVQEALMDNGIPTYFLAQPQETKQAFLRLLRKLQPMNLIALLRRIDERVVLRVVSRPAVKQSNILINWALLFATVATTFVTGYLLSSDVINPYVGGAAFTVAMLAVLGTHEMGHKITANKKGIDATLPYFIPGPPPLGTFGAVIMQKSLPPNKDALFDVGADGPIAGFLIAIIVSIVGLMLSTPSPPSANTIGVPLVWNILEGLMRSLSIFPKSPVGWDLLLHPVAFAGWVGMLVTTLNLLPAAMLDGGHVARSVFGERLGLRLVLAALSIVYLAVEGLIPMAFLVLLMLFFRHPGPLDDVSGLSTGRKLVALGLVGIFVLCFVPLSPIF